MNPIIIDTTEDTPAIHLDAKAEIYKISGRSLPENAHGFYQTVFDWIEEYMQSPNDKTIFEFDLEYFNTASAKQIAKVLLFLEKLAQKADVLIKWYYKKEDIDMLSSGERYAKLIDIKFEVIEID